MSSFPLIHIFQRGRYTTSQLFCCEKQETDWVLQKICRNINGGPCRRTQHLLAHFHQDNCKRTDICAFFTWHLSCTDLDLGWWPDFQLTKMCWTWSQHPEVPRYQRTPWLRGWSTGRGRRDSLFPCLFFRNCAFACLIICIWNQWYIFCADKMRDMREDAGFKVPLPSRCWAEVHPYYGRRFLSHGTPNHPSHSNIFVLKPMVTWGYASH